MRLPISPPGLLNGSNEQVKVLWVWESTVKAQSQQGILSLSLQILKREGVLLFFLTLLYTFFDQRLTAALEESIRDSSSAIWPLGAISFIVSLLWPLLLLLVIAHAASDSPHSPWTLIRSSFEQVCIESLRSWGKTLFWSLLLIAPGIVRYIQLLFVPLIVLFDPNYSAGTIDALGRSTSLVNRNFLRVLGFIVLFSILIPLGVTSLTADYKDLIETPISGLFLTGLDVVISVIAMAALLRLYWKLSK
ncbi:MAG: hypothetical protein AB7O96_04965 [Pseudobdellovibrionaceae bacterium]